VARKIRKTTRETRETTRETTAKSCEITSKPATPPRNHCKTTPEGSHRKVMRNHCETRETTAKALRNHPRNHREVMQNHRESVRN
jgi:hypothetical protein